MSDMGDQGFFLRVALAASLTVELWPTHTFVLLVAQPVSLILVLLSLANGTDILSFLAKFNLRLPYVL